jgi:hypothetical protein
MGEKYVQEEFLGEEPLGEKYMGEKFVQEECLGEKSLGENTGRWEAGFRSPLLRYVSICFNMFQSISPCFTISWQGSGRSGEYGCFGGQVKRKGGCRDGADCPNCHECFWTKARENSDPRSLTAESKDAVQSTYDLKFEGCRILTRMRKS